MSTPAGGQRPTDTARDQVARLLVLVPFLHARGVVTVGVAAVGLSDAGCSLRRQAAGYGSGGFYRSQYRPSSFPQRFSPAWRP